MYLYSNTLTESDLDAIADDMGIRVERGEFFGARRRRISFVLRPGYDSRRERFRATRSGRRINAVSWSGHYVFMRALFTLDPSAEIRSSVARYVGALDFAASAFATGSRNVGSQWSPEDMRYAEGVEHVVWSDESDLAAMGDEIAARVRDGHRAFDRDLSRHRCYGQG